MAIRVCFGERGLAMSGAAPSINWRARREATTTYANLLSGGRFWTVIKVSTSKSFQDSLNDRTRPAAAATRAESDGVDLAPRSFEVVIHHNKIVQRETFHFLAGLLQAPC